MPASSVPPATPLRTAPSAATAARVVAPFAAGYFLSYLYRVVNAVIAPDLLRELELRPDALGLLTAAYFLAFAAAQLPLGIALDRSEPRTVEAGLLLLAATGAALFAEARSLPVLVAARALIGLGVAACLMAAFRTFVAWFPPGQLPRINGIQMAAGGLGALSATAPVEWALGWTDWRGLFRLLAGVTAAVAVLVWSSVPHRPPPGRGETLAGALGGVRAVLTNRTFWRITPWVVASQASFMALQGLWAGPWLSDVAGLERAAVARTLSGLACAMVAGFLVLGTLAGRLRGSGAQRVAVAGMVGFIAVQGALLVLGPVAPAALWLAFGFFGTAGILAYAVLTQAFPSALAGRVNTTLNLLVFVAAFAAQWGLGALLGRWAAAGSTQLPVAAHRAGLACLLACQIAGATWYGWAGRRPAR